MSFGSAGGGGAAGICCAGGVAGAMAAGDGATGGAGSCGFCSGGGSGLFSEVGNDIGAGSFTGVGKSTRGVETGVSFTAGAEGTAGRCAGSPTDGATGWTAAVS